jgi:ATP synthase F1 complex assembly factor 2
MQQLLTPRVPLQLPLIVSSSASASSSQTQHSPQWFGVTLDGRILKTPLGTSLALPSKALALAVAAEWDLLHTHTIQPVNMPLMTLACTALDQTASNPAKTRTEALQYLPHDTTCFWADPLEDRALNRRQTKHWQPLHNWVASPHGLSHTPGTIYTNDGLLLRGLPHPEQLLQNANTWVDSLDAWHLTALQAVASEAKSFLVAMAVVKGVSLSSFKTSTKAPFHDTAKAVAASRVEEEFQIECWGLVEGGHDYDRLNCSISIHAASFFVQSIALHNHWSPPPLQQQEQEQQEQQQ